MEYAGATAAAETVHISSDEDDFRLLGAHGFIYFPTLDWQVLIRWHMRPRPLLEGQLSMLWSSGHSTTFRCWRLF